MTCVIFLFLVSWCKFRDKSYVVYISKKKKKKKKKKRKKEKENNEKRRSEYAQEIKRFCDCYDAFSLAIQLFRSI